MERERSTPLEPMDVEPPEAVAHDLPLTPMGVMRALAGLLEALLATALTATFFRPAVLRHLPLDRRALIHASLLQGFFFLATLALQLGVMQAMGAQDSMVAPTVGLAAGFVVACWRYPGALVALFASGAGVALVWTGLLAAHAIGLGDAMTSWVPFIWQVVATFQVVERLRLDGRLAA